MAHDLPRCASVCRAPLHFAGKRAASHLAWALLRRPFMRDVELRRLLLRLAAAGAPVPLVLGACGGIASNGSRGADSGGSSSMGGNGGATPLTGRAGPPVFTGQIPSAGGMLGVPPVYAGSGGAPPIYTGLGGTTGGPPVFAGAGRPGFIYPPDAGVVPRLDAAPDPGSVDSGFAELCASGQPSLPGCASPYCFPLAAIDGGTGSGMEARCDCPAIGCVRTPVTLSCVWFS